MKFKTKNLIVDNLHSIGENVGLLNIGERSFQLDKRLFHLLFEPLEEEKQETFKCKECKEEFLLEANPASIDNETEIICVDCTETILWQRRSEF